MRLIAVLDGLRLGFTRVPLYSLVFYCRAVGGELAPHPLECRDVGWFTRDTLPHPLVGSERWGEHVFAAISGEHRDVLYDSVRQPMWRGGSTDDVIAVEAAASVDDDLVAAVAALVPQLSRPRRRRPAAQLERIVDDPRHHALRGAGRGRVVGMLTLATFRIPTAVRAWIEDVVVDECGAGAGCRPPRWSRPRSTAPPSRRPHGRPDVAARPRGGQPALRTHGLRGPQHQRVPPDLERA